MVYESKPASPTAPFAHWLRANTRARNTALVLTTAFLALLGCGNDRATSGDGDAGSESDARHDDGTSEPVLECSGPGFHEATSLWQLDQLTTRVVDLDGNGVPDLRAQACGINLCINETSDSDGNVVIVAGQEFEKPALKYGLGQRFVKFAYLLPRQPVQTLEAQVTAPFPEIGSGRPLVPGTVVESSGVELAISEETDDIDIDPFDYDTEDLRRFRAVEIPVESAPAAVDPSLGLERLFGLTPVGAILCPAAKMTVDNALDWEPGTAVEFFLHGVEVTEEYAPYGGWAKVSDGQVDSEGATISTNDAGGIPILSVIGIRRADR